MSRENLIDPVEDTNTDSFKRRLFDAIEGVLNGRTRNQGSVTLNANATTTVVDDPLFESHQTVTFSPLTANAAGDLTGMFVSARSQGQFTITHPNTADTDKSFEYVITG